MSQSEPTMVEGSGLTIPWASPVSWQAANRAVDYHLQAYHADLKPLKILARAIESVLISVFSFLDDLCAHSCPRCPDPCCLKASIWYDFKDLLFLQLGQLSLPRTQPIDNSRLPCRYLGPGGCRLPRIVRPWICTWYLCPTQTARLRNRRQGEHELLNRGFAQIKARRNLLESEYIRMIS